MLGFVFLCLQIVGQSSAGVRRFLSLHVWPSSCQFVVDLGVRLNLECGMNGGVVQT